jgi:outer membrane murein-binding lipoprotein Lpp
MADDPEHLVLVSLRRLDAKMDQLSEDICDLKGRVSALENGLNAVRRDLVSLAEADAAPSFH